MGRFRSGEMRAKAGKAGRRVVIDRVVVELPLGPDGEPAIVTIHAHSGRGGPLDFEVSASAGTVEPTAEPNVFLWHLPPRNEGAQFE